MRSGGPLVVSFLFICAWSMIVPYTRARIEAHCCVVCRFAGSQRDGSGQFLIVPGESTLDVSLEVK